MDLNLKNGQILEELTPYVVVTPFNRSYLDTCPFGVQIPDENFVNPLRLESEGFLLLLQQLDALTFGPEGMPMPRWVFFDCSEMPGAIFGFAKKAADVDDETRVLYGIPDDYDGLVPHSMYIAIPMTPPGAWFGHNLCSISPSLSSNRLKGLGSLTKSLALKCFRTKQFYGATQWDSSALFIHAKFGPLGLMTAYTPAHSEPLTLTYFFEVTEAGLLNAAGDPTITIPRDEADFTLAHAEEEKIIALQDEIEAGGRYIIPSAPIPESDGTFRIPVLKCP